MEMTSKNSGKLLLSIASSLVNLLWMKGLLTDVEKAKIDEKNKVYFLSN